MAASSANTSATGGYLAPSSPPPADDLALDIILQALIVGVTGLAGDLVRPRWQDTPAAAGGALPRMPDVGKTWCGVGVVSTEADDTPAMIHSSAGDGSTTLRRFERLEVLASFYGPKGEAYARLTRDSLYIAQNREALRTDGIELVSTDPIRRIPEIIATGTRRRSDLPFRLTRRVERTYPILNVLQGIGTIVADLGTDGTPEIVRQPFAAPEN